MGASIDKEKNDIVSELEDSPAMHIDARMSILTDIGLSEISEEHGFKVKEIIVARRNETASQQYSKIGDLVQYVRESIIILEK